MDSKKEPSFIEWFIKYRNSGEREEGQGDLKSANITLRFMLHGTFVYVNGELFVGGDYNSILSDEIPSDNFFRRQIEGVEKLNSQGYHITYKGPKSQDEWDKLAEEVDRLSYVV